MELEDSVLNVSDEDESFEDDEDVKMNDIEEGELLEKISKTGLKETGGACASFENPLSGKKNRRRRKNNGKNKRKRVSSGPITDINRFVLDVGRRLKERKSYLIWNAVGCLGLSALSDLVKEVDAIQTCGGQKTADGRRFRTGGGILWSILKVRDPNAYKEIMKKGKEFEKQFKQANLKQEPLQNKEASLERSSQTMGDEITASSSDVLLQQEPVEQSNSGAKHASVHDRIRMPVTYDDLFDEGKDSKDPLALIMPSEKSSYDVVEGGYPKGI
ncbi:hypothetical protein R3W88_013167 [Solanum pinnatisectum]|uniref:Phosphorylated adapter RNA export protein n=1 Tax=Solanum pinnatisectum TaxID=50273 RepID=A0AAV9LBC3_9SOLN|nr:hypothetical protein R3W88_013167 [Solanum pinnatisectum]